MYRRGSVDLVVITVLVLVAIYVAARVQYGGEAAVVGDLLAVLPG